MTIRERWTVYPLLFLALGLAVRGSVLLPPSQPAGLLRAVAVEAGTVACQELVIRGSDAKTVILHAGRVEGGGGGRIEIRDADGVDAIAVGTTVEDRGGVLEFFDKQGRPQLRFNPQAPGRRPEPERER